MRLPRLGLLLLLVAALLALAVAVPQLGFRLHSSSAILRCTSVRTPGCTSEFSRCLFPQSLKTIAPRAGRSIVRSGRRMDRPNRATIFFQAGRPGPMSAWAARSAE